MKRTSLIPCVLLVAAGLFPATPTERGDSRSADRILCDEKFRILGPDAGDEIGIYTIKGSLHVDTKTIEIVETLSMDYRGKKAEYESSVIYRSESPITPKRGSVETKLDGKRCMTGAVTFSEGKLSLRRVESEVTK